MVGLEPLRQETAAPDGAPVPSRLPRAITHMARFLAALPALVLGLALLRVAELIEGWPPGATAGAGLRIAAAALAQDALTLARYLPLLFVASWPLLALPGPRARYWSIGGLWSLLLVAQLALVGYFLNTRVVLGADLFSYSWSEIGTSAGGFDVDPVIAGAALIAVGALWAVLRVRIDRAASARATLVLFALSLGAWAAAPRDLPRVSASETEYAHTLRESKLAAFIEANWDKFVQTRAAGARQAVGEGNARAQEGASSNPILGFQYVDPRYPFLHRDQTPDVLGEHFVVDRNTPPNLVFVIVEGLGRSFSGPDAELGSFTPFLDDLARRSLYFENFLAGQGRTFAVLPSIFGSLPYGEEGFLAHGAAMPEHATLLSLLKAQGYHTRFYCGFDTTFDNELAFLQRQGVDEIYGRDDFGDSYPRISYWGYDDNELVSFALAHEAQPTAKPFVDVVQTVSTHDPYRFLGQEQYASRLEQRLNELGLTEAQKGRYRQQRSIYQSVLYTDDALRRYFESVKTQPWFAHTIFIITGDHRLPEIPMGDWIDRYHVPLIVYSPLLKQAQRIKAVSSQFDIAPSLLAFLANGYGLRTPERATWIGSGLDLEPRFRNIHELPLKQTKPILDSFVHGQWAVNRDTLYRLHDGLSSEPSADAKRLAQVQSRFSAFRDANEAFEHVGTLMPAGASDQLAAYEAGRRAAVDSAPELGPALAVREVDAPSRAREGALAVDVVLSSTDPAEARMAVPLAVLQTAQGVELSESYGKALRIPARGDVRQHLAIKTDGVPPGQYYLSVFPSDPDSGVRIGDGRFHIPVVLEP